MIRLRTALLAAAAAALAGCAGREGPIPQQSQTFQGLTMRRTAYGAPQWTLRARQASVREADGTVELQAPQVALFDKGRPVTEARSRRGLFHQGSQDLSLEGGVVVSGREAGGAGAVTLRTEALDYDSTTRLFKTDREVLIERPGSRMKGRGMTATHDLSEIRISRQEAVFE